MLALKSPGSELVVGEYDWVVERGSLWYWLKNRHLYADYRGLIDQMLWQNAPITAEIAGIPRPFLRYKDPLNFPITDDWVAENLDRLKLAWITVLVEAPVPIRTQLFKHKIGFVENEVSRRYVDSPPRFFLPDIWRARAPGVKQGSLKTPMKYAALAKKVAQFTYFISNMGYHTVLKLGGCPEQARFLLSQGMMTQWYWTGSLDAVFRAIHLRNNEHAQEESWKIMQQIQALVEQQWPKTFQKMSITSSPSIIPPSLKA